MATNPYSAGEVGIDILPVFDKFYPRLRAGLAKAKAQNFEVTANLDLDTAAYYAKKERIDGQSLTNNVYFKSDASGVNKIMRQYEKLRKDMGDLTFKPKVDSSEWDKSISSMVNDAQDRLQAASKVTLEGPDSDVDKWVDTYVSKLENLSTMLQRVNKLEDEFREARMSGKTEDAKKYAKALQKMDVELEDTVSDLQKFRTTMDDLDFNTSSIDDFRNRLDSTKGSVSDLASTISQKLGKNLGDQTFADLTNDLKGLEERLRATSGEADTYNSFLKNMQRNARSARSQSEKLNTTVSKQDKLLSMVADAWDETDENQVRAESSLSTYRKQAQQAVKQLDEMDKELSSLQNAFKKFGDIGSSGNDTYKELSSFLREISVLRQEIERNPIEARVVLDDDEFERKYADVLLKASRLEEQLDKKYQIDVTIEGYESKARELEAWLAKLNRQRLDIPVDLQVDVEDLAKEYHKAAMAASIGSDIDIDATLDVDTARARRRIEDFIDEHDTLDMDLDLTTKTAMAHLAYFTRPRTIDIYLNVKSTDLGKIISGMTSGATGLNAVTNQFQKLVNMMDSLDQVIPKVSLLGSVLVSLGAGATNVAASIGGLGSSLITMSKALLAAPSAIAGLTSAFVAGRYAVQYAGDQFDVTATQLDGLAEAVGDAAWEQFGDTLYELADSVAPSLTAGLSDVAVAEGRMADNLMQIVMQADDAGALETIFENTTDAVNDLNPGIASLVDAFLSLGDVTSEFLPRMASYISDVAQSFADWVNEASRTGEIYESLEAVIEQAGYLKSSVQSLADILSGTFGTLAQYENGIQGISEALAAADEAVNSVKFQDVFTSLIDGAQEAQSTVRDAFSGIGDDIWSLRDTFENVFADAGTIVASVLSNVSDLLADAGDGINDFADGVASGWTKAMDAIGDSGDVFSDLLSMVGQLADTFGGTLASALRVTSPLLETIANVAETVAAAFDSLPEPIKQVITLWTTFGKAGQEALTAIKTGMLSNIAQTAQYQQSLNALGLTANTVDTSFGNVLQSWLAMKGVDLNGTFTSTNTALSKVTSTAASSSAAMSGLSTAAVSSASAVASTSSKSSGLSSALSKVGSVAKSAGSALLSALVSPASAVAAGFTAIMLAMSDYESKAQATESANSSLASSLDEITVEGDYTTEAIEGVADAVNELWDTEGYGQADSVFDWLESLSNKYDSVAESAEAVGISTSDLTDALMSGQSGVDAMVSELDKLEQQYIDTYGDAALIDGQAEAYDYLATQLQNVYDEMVAQIAEQAELNGVSSETIYKMAESGASIEEMANAAAGAELETNALNDAMEQLNSMADNQRSAFINVQQAESDYYDTLDGMADVVSEVNDLAASGQQVWDGTAQSFDMTTEAGRTAADAMLELGNDTNSYIEAMIESGESTDTVTAKYEEMRQALIEQAMQFGLTEDEAAAYVDQLLYTPDEIDTMVNLQTQDAKDAISELAETLQSAGFAEDEKDYIINFLTEGLEEGTLSIEQVESLCEQLSTGDYTIAITPDGDYCLAELSHIEEYAEQLDDGTWQITIDADDMASEDIDNISSKLSDANVSWRNIKIFLEAEDGASSKLTQVQQIAEALGLTEEEITLIANTDNASSDLDSIKQKLYDMGLTETQVDVLLDAIDNASEKFDAVQEEAENAHNQVIDYRIEADDSSAKATFATWENTSDIEKNLTIDGDDSGAMNAYTAANALMDIAKWLYVYGDASDAEQAAGNAQTAIEAIPVSHMTTLSAEGNTTSFANAANSAVIAIPVTWGTVLSASGNTSSFSNTARSAVRAIPTKWATALSASGNTSSFSNTARSAVRAIPTKWATVLNASGNTTSFSNTAYKAVTKVPTSRGTVLNSSGNTITRAGQAYSAITRIPTSRGSTITATTNGLTGVQNLYNAIASIKSKTVTITTKTQTVSAATGGRISGPGSGTSDSIPAMLSNGEFVIRASSVSKLDSQYGKGFLNYVNQMGKIPENRQQMLTATVSRSSYAYADGGRVTLSGVEMSVNPTVNVTNEYDSKLSDEVALLREDFNSFRNEIGYEIAENSSPWPSRTAFNRDVGRAVRNR